MDPPPDPVHDSAVPSHRSPMPEGLTNVTEYSSVVRTRAPLALLLALLLIAIAGPAAAQLAPADSAAAGQATPQTAPQQAPEAAPQAAPADGAATQTPPAETPQVLESTGT